MSLFQKLKDRIQGKAPKGARRSSAWRKIRKAHITKYPYCSVCGRKSKVEVHHKIPFHVAPDLELHPDNLTTLCENKKNGINCHLLVGHLGNYRKVNLSVDIDVMTWRMKLEVFERNADIKKPIDEEKRPLTLPEEKDEES